jgi:hypothetical protein
MVPHLALDAPPDRWHLPSVHGQELSARRDLAGGI